MRLYKVNTRKAFLLLLISIGFLLISQYAGAQINCNGLASITVATDKETYTAGETVTGSISFTNKADVSADITFNGKIFKNEVFILEKTETALIQPGENKFSLADLFGDLELPPGSEGHYRIEIASGIPDFGCQWYNETAFEVSPVDCENLASVNVTVDQDTYTSGETITGSISVENKYGETAPVDLQLALYQQVEGKCVMFWSRQETLDIPPEGLNVALADAFDFTATIPADDSFLGNWKLEFIAKAGGCEWKAEDGFEIVLPSMKDPVFYEYILHNQDDFLKNIDQVKDYTNMVVLMPIPVDEPFGSLPTREELSYAINNDLKVIISLNQKFFFSGNAVEQQNIVKLKELLNGYETNIYAIHLADEPTCAQYITAEELQRRADVIKQNFPKIKTAVSYAAFDYLINCEGPNKGTIPPEYVPENLDVLSMFAYPCADQDITNFVVGNLRKLKNEYANERPIVFIPRSYKGHAERDECTPTSEMVREIYDAARMVGVEIIMWWFYDDNIITSDIGKTYGALHYPNALAEQKTIGCELGFCSDSCGNGICEPGETPANCPEDCEVVCDGYFYNGDCWYQGDYDQSCDEVCSTHGGCKSNYVAGRCDVCRHFYETISMNCLNGNYADPGNALAPYRLKNYDICVYDATYDGICECGTSHPLAARQCPCKGASICGNGVCEEGEDIYNCPEDCVSPDLPQGYQRRTLDSGSTVVYPIVTHYDGTDFNMFGSVADTRTFKPSYEHYPASITDSHAPSVSETEKFVNVIEELSGYKVIVENYFGEDYLNPIIESNKIQVINNVFLRKSNGFERDGTSLFTIILPPDWNPEKSYPIVLSGNGYGTSNNQRVILYNEKSDPERNKWAVVANIKETDGGYITVFSNAGGIHNLGASDNALADVRDILDYVSDKFNGDKHSVINIGTSRGGMTAMLWAANPKDYDYTSIGVFASVMPTQMGTKTTYPLANFPHLANFYNGLMYDSNAWNYSFNPMWGIEPLQVLIPYYNTTKESVGNLRGVYGNLDRLKSISDKGNPIVIEFSSHDSIVSFNYALVADRKMNELGIAHQSCITSKRGHGCSNACIENQLKGYLLHLLKDKDYNPKNERIFYIKNIFSCEKVELPVSEFPLTVHIPFTFAHNIPRTEPPYFDMQPAQIEVCGPNGFEKTTKISQYFVEENTDFTGEYDYCPDYNPAEHTLVTYNLNTLDPARITYDGEDCVIFEIKKQEFPKTGKYCWKFETQGKEISPYNTPFAWDETRPMRTVTFVTDEQQHPDTIHQYQNGPNCGPNCGGEFIGWPDSYHSGISQIPTCGNGVCEEKYTENKYTCPDDCEDDCSKLASVNVTVDKDTYTFGETITGSISVENKYGETAPVDLQLGLYKYIDNDWVMFWSRQETLDIPPEGLNVDLATAFDFTPTIPVDDNLVGNWKLEFTAKAGECEWKAEDGFGVVKPTPLESVRDLFDIEAIKKMSLEDLEWQETSRYTENGMIIVKGTYKSGPWTTIDGENLEKLKRGEHYDTVTINMVHPVKLYIPENYPHIAGNGYGIADAVQIEELLDMPDYLETAKLAAKYELPYLIHANKNEIFPLGEINRQMAASLDHIIDVNSTSLEAQKLCIGYFLIRKNLMAHTLLQRLLEQEGGNITKDIIARGGSKQGWCIHLTSFVDDRIIAAVPESCHLRDIYKGTRREMTDWGCSRPNAHYLFKEYYLKFGDFFISGPAGDTAKTCFDIAYNTDLMLSYPDFMLLTGSTGIEGSHDSAFPLGSETEFLLSSSFNQIDNRYFLSSGEDCPFDQPRCNPRRERISPIIEKLFYNTSWVKIKNISVDQTPNPEAKVTFISVSTELNEATPNAKVRLWYAFSDNARWDDEADGSWQAKEMVYNPAIRKWTTTLETPTDKETGFYVETEDVRKSVATGEDVKFFDASPVQFVNEFPPCQKCGDCNCLAWVSVDAGKEIYSFGETIMGNISITNNFGVEGEVNLTLKLFKGNNLFLSRNKILTIPTGKTTYDLATAFDFTPIISFDDNFLGNWKLEFTAKAGECEWTDEDRFEIVKQGEYNCVPLDGIWGEKGYQKCTLDSGSTVEWPILTRYNAATDKYDPYGHDVDPHGEFPLGDVVHPAYSHYNRYPYEITANYAPSPDDVNKVIESIESFGHKVDMYNDVSKVITDGSNPNVQIVNNFRTGYGETNIGNTKNGMYIFVFPPYFSKADKLPILSSQPCNTPVSDFYRCHFMNSQNTLIQLIAQSKDGGRNGIIGIMPPSGGGGGASLGLEDESLDAFAEVITFLKNNFNADNHKIAVYGGCRGGTSTLIRAANPRNHDYKVIAAFAGFPPTLTGSSSQATRANFPYLGVYDIFYKAWRHWKTPNRPPTQEEIEAAMSAWKYNSISPPNIDNKSYICQTLLNTIDINEGDQRSILGVADKEHFGGKYLVLSYGSQDSIIPYHLSIKLDAALRDAGVAHKTNIELKSGHTGRNRYEDEGIEQYVLNFFARGIIPEEMPNGRYYYIEDIAHHGAQNASYIGNENEGMELSFSAIVPTVLDSKIDFDGYDNQYIGKQQPADIVLVGAKGKSFKIHLLDENHKFLKEWRGVFGQGTDGDEYHVIPDIHFGCSGTCTYYWKFWYAGKEVSSYNTPFVDEKGDPKEAVTEVVTSQLHPKEIVGDYYHGLSGLTMGVDSLPTCGNNVCEEKYTENKYTCPEDCGGKCNELASVNVTVDQNIYTFGETITGSISVENKIGETAPVDLQLGLYKYIDNDWVMFWSRQETLDIPPEGLNVALADAFDFTATIPVDDNFLGNWKLEFAAKAEECEWSAEDGFEIVDGGEYDCIPLEGIWGEKGYQKCTLASGSTVEWPILTRYNVATDKYDPYGHDADPHETFPHGGSQSTYANYNRYPFEITSNYAPTPDEVKGVIECIESFGQKVDMYNDISRVITDGSNPNVQIVHSFRTGWGETNIGDTNNGLYIFVFPPHFSKTDKLPILAENPGSATPMNLIYYHKNNESLKLVAKSKENGGNGVIGIICPGWGLSNQGLDEEELDSFADAITFLKEEFNADNHRIAIFGGSRGGDSCLMRTINPRNHDYKVIAAFAGAAPTAIGSHSQVTRTNWPALGMYDPLYKGWRYWLDPSMPPTQKEIEEANNAWKYNSKYPPNIDDKCYICQPLLNTTDIEEGDKKSNIGYADIEHFGGKYLVITFRPQDIVIPFHLSIEFDEALRNAGVAHKTGITLKGDHTGGDGILIEELEKYVLDYLARGISPDELPDGRYYVVDDIKTHDYRRRHYIGNENEGMELPFAAIVPTGLDSKIDFGGYDNEYIDKQQPADIVLVGAKGKSFKVYLLDEDHNFLEEWGGVFGQGTLGEEYHIIPNIQFNCPETDTCTYYWKFWYDDKEVSSYNTPFIDEKGDPREAETKVFTWQPSFVDIQNYYSSPGITMGVVSLPTCGNGICEEWEHELTCPEDCSNCSGLASVNVTVDQDTYTFGETITGSISVENKYGETASVDLQLALYQQIDDRWVMFWSRHETLDIPPEGLNVALADAFDFAATIPVDDSFLGNWKLEFVAKARGCEWRAEDGFEVVAQAPNLSISLEMNKDVFYLGDFLNGVLSANCTLGKNIHYSLEIFKDGSEYKDWSGEFQCDNGNITFEIYNLFSEYCIDSDACFNDIAFAQIPYDGYNWLGDYSITATVSDGQHTVSDSDDFIIDPEAESEKKFSIDIDLNKKVGEVPNVYRFGNNWHPPEGLPDYYLKKEASEFFNPVYRLVYYTTFNINEMDDENWESIIGGIKYLSSKVKILQTKGVDVEINIWGMPRYLSSMPEEERIVAFTQPIWANVPPRDYEEWSNFIEKIVREFENQGITNVLYGMWNEPEAAFVGTEAEFAKTYVWFEKGVKRANPLLKSGIPELCIAGASRVIYNLNNDPITRTYSDEIYMEELINALGNYSEEIDLDYFGGHYEIGGAYPDLESNLTGKMELINELLSKNGFYNVKYNIGEWTAVNFCSGVMATEIASSRFPQVLKVYEDAGIDRHTYFYQLDMSPPDIAVPFVCWKDNGLVRGDSYEAVSKHGPVRATYNAFRALSVVSENERIDIDDSSIFSLASTDGKKTAILLSNYNPLSRDVTLNIDNLAQGNLKVRTFTIDKEHSNVCRLNQKTATGEPITPRDKNCGKNGEIDKLTKQADEDAAATALVVSRDLLISKGYSETEADTLLDTIQVVLEACAGSTDVLECATEKIMSECLNYWHYPQEKCEEIVDDAVDTYIEFTNAKESLFFYGDYKSSYGSYNIDVSIDSMNNMDGISLESSMQEKSFISDGSYNDEFELNPFTVKLIIIGSGCSDGILYNQCNADGLYCNDFGQLVDDCEHCGCKQGTCYHKECVVLAACGNGICEQGETLENCPEDCDTPPLPQGYQRRTLDSGSTVVYPIVTHYDGTDFNMLGSVADTRTFKPSYEHYPASITDSHAPSVSETEKFVNAIEELSEYQLIVENYFGEDYLNPIVESGRIQVINNVLLRKADGFERDGTSLFTIVLPPDWNPEKSYPIVLTGNGYGTSNNRQRIILRHIRELRAIEETDGGYITVYSNAGGIHSIGSTENNLRDVSDILGYVSNKFSGNKYSVINCGNSRGGWTAMLWALNPKDYDYKSVAIFAGVAPTFGGKTLTMPFADAGSAWFYDAYDEGSWKYDHTPAPFTLPIKALEGFFGNGYPEVVDRTLSPAGLIEKWRGKYIDLTWGSHDGSALVQGFYLEPLLIKANIPHTTRIVLKGSHESGYNSDAAEEVYLKNFPLKEYLVDLIINNITPQVKDQREFYIQTDLQTHDQAGIEFIYNVSRDDKDSALPFISLLPLRVGIDIPNYGQEPANLYVFGTKGKAWKVEMYLENQDGSRDLKQAFLGIFGYDSDHDEFDVVPLKFAEVGTYRWKCYYDGKEISPFNTAAADHNNIPYETVTIVTRSQVDDYWNYVFKEVGPNGVLPGVAQIPTCGNNVCESQYTENKYTCPEDCGNCSELASVNVTVDQDTYTFGETITGSISVENKLGETASVDLQLALYQEIDNNWVMFWSRHETLDIPVEGLNVDLADAFDFTPTIPTDYFFLGNWKIEFTANAGGCEWKAEDGFEVLDTGYHN